MNSKLFYGVLVVLVVGFATLAIISQSQPEPQRLGDAHDDNGREHVKSKDYGDPDEPPTSGDHADPMPWGPYDRELPDVNTIHNLEHGGIYVSYQPDLPAEQVEAMKQLLFAPYTDSEFQPNKVIMAPRAANASLIVISSWQRSIKLDAYDKQKIIDYYTTNAGKSPEPLAR